MKRLFILMLLFTVFSCNKTPLNEASESFWGTWKHKPAADEAHTIVITENGSGYMTYTRKNKESNPTNTKDWFLDNNELSFGKWALNGQAYEVEEYPKLNSILFNNFYDTIPAGKRYMVLDGNYYVEQ